MLITCPMCGLFSNMNYWNYKRSDEFIVKQKLETALAHLNFTLEFCIC